MVGNVVCQVQNPVKISTSSTLSANCNQSDESSDEHSDELGTGTVEGSSKLIFVFILTLP